MVKVTEQKQGKIWDKMKNEARATNFLPRLYLGGKNDEIRHVVEFLNDEPRETEFKDKFYKNPATGKNEPDTLVPGLVLDVKVLETTHEDTKVGNHYAIFMRADPENGLTAAIANLAKNVGKLNGVKASIETNTYKHKTWGDTKGFVVTQIDSEETD